MVELDPVNYWLPDPCRPKSSGQGHSRERIDAKLASVEHHVASSLTFVARVQCLT
jgi:hypothetical protein